jgi:hypothetical protein
MVDFKKLGDRAKDLVEKRGGTESLKQDAAELKEIATGKGSLSDKAKAAAAALKDPGSRAEQPTEPQPMPAEPTEPQPTPTEPTEPAGAADERAERKERRAERRKERAEHREGGGEAA